MGLGRWLASSSKWQLTAVAVAEGREIPIGIPHRTGEVLFCVESMLCMPYFATINLSNGWDVVAMFVMVRRH